MPVKSAKQFRFMQTHAHAPGIGGLAKVAQEFLDKTPHKVKSRFAKALRRKKK